MAAEGDAMASRTELPGPARVPGEGLTLEVACPGAQAVAWDETASAVATSRSAAEAGGHWDETASPVATSRSAAQAGGSRTHAVTVTADWRLLTPHDLDAERIGVALGGVCGCVDLVDRTWPAVRGYLHHRLRLGVAEVIHPSDGSWRVAVRVAYCCDDPGFPHVRDAAAHLRRTRHWARRFGAPLQDVSELARRVLAALAATHPWITTDLAVDQPCPAASDSGAPYLVEPYGLALLWDAGVHPCFVPGLWREVAPDGVPVATGRVIEWAYRAAEDAPLPSFARERATWPQWGIVSAHQHPEERQTG